MSKTKLRECAFCGSDDVGLLSCCVGEGESEVRCNHCGTRGPKKDTERKAVNAWNKRPREKELEATSYNIPDSIRVSRDIKTW